MDKISEIRKELKTLERKVLVGDIRNKDYQKKWIELSLQLKRQMVLSTLEPGERILSEHHFYFTPPIYKMEKETTDLSYYATDRRLSRVECHGTEELLDSVPYGDIRSIDLRSEIRWGQICTGAGIFLFAYVFRGFLQITEYPLMALGFSGTLHALFRKTLWFQVEGKSLDEKKWRIYAARKKSAKNLISTIRGYLR